MSPEEGAPKASENQQADSMHSPHQPTSYSSNSDDELLSGSGPATPQPSSRPTYVDKAFQNLLQKLGNISKEFDPQHPVPSGRSQRPSRSGQSVSETVRFFTGSSGPSQHATHQTVTENARFSQSPSVDQPSVAPQYFLGNAHVAPQPPVYPGGITARSMFPDDAVDEFIRQAGGRKPATEFKSDTGKERAEAKVAMSARDARHALEMHDRKVLVDMANSLRTASEAISFAASVYARMNDVDYPSEFAPLPRPDLSIPEVYRDANMEGGDEDSD